MRITETTKRASELSLNDMRVENGEAVGKVARLEWTKAQFGNRDQYPEEDAIMVTFSRYSDGRLFSFEVTPDCKFTVVGDVLGDFDA